MDKEIKEKLHIEKVVNTGRLYPMKEACEQTGLAYETLKFDKEPKILLQHRPCSRRQTGCQEPPRL